MAVPGSNTPPLDARKRALMVTTRGLIRGDRPTALVAVSIVGGVTTYTLLSGAVFRQHMVSDQTTALTQGSSQVDALCELPLVDPVSLVANDPTKIAYLALTGTATAGGVAAAEKYELLSYKRGGMVVNRYVCQLRRLR